ncbi:MAG: ABC transporter ATP-binding protein [Candidatus Acidiferrales bacterium]
MFGLMRSLVRPYRGTLLVILLVMIVQTAMSVAGPWPLKIILDNVVGSHKLPHWLDHLLGPLLGSGTKMQIAFAAAVAAVIIASLGALASYIANYYTTSVGQWVANDLRMRTYHHLQQLSLSYYDTHQTGALLSTITSDVQTIQNFASAATLDIAVDMLTIVLMLFIMFWLNWDFTLIAVSVTPFMLLFVARFKKEVKKATHEVRRQQSNVVAVVEQGLQSMRVVQAFGRQDLAQEELGTASRASVDAALKQSPPREGTLVSSGRRHRLAMRGCGAVARRGVDSRRRHDRWRADCVSLVPGEILQARARPGDHDEFHRANRGWGGPHPSDPRRRHGDSRARRRARSGGARG